MLVLYGKMGCGGRRIGRNRGESHFPPKYQCTTATEPEDRLYRWVRMQFEMAGALHGNPERLQPRQPKKPNNHPRQPGGWRQDP